MIMVWRWTEFSAFFALGNSNSFATIDISNAYLGNVYRLFLSFFCIHHLMTTLLLQGLERYNEFAVGFLTFVIGYSGPIYFYLALIIGLAKYSSLRYVSTVLKAICELIESLVLNILSV
jgi:hypothetical protein